MNRINIIKLMILSAFIGCISGLVIGAFLILLEFVVELNLSFKWLIFILPFSGLLMTYLYKKYGKNSKKGNNLIIESINGGEEKIHIIMAPLVFLGTILTHLFGGSVGREGTGVQIGGTVASYFSDILKKSDQDRKVLLISGVAAGFSAVFGTPLTAIIFAVEISTVGSISYMSMLPAIAAAIIADITSKSIGVTHSHFPVPSIEAFNVMNVGKVIIIAICFGLASKLFVFAVHKFKDIFGRYTKSDYIKVFIGGVLMILVTLILGNSLYNNLSLNLLQNAFKGDVPEFAFIIKLILTTLCLAVGFQGGEVTPLFVIGATLGVTLASILGIPVVFAASLGLIGVFAGATNAPLASFVLYLELFGSTNLIFVMLICVISVFISGRKGIYSSQEWLEY